MHLHYARGLTQMARRRHADALADFRIAEQLSGVFASPRALGRPLRALMLLSHAELGETGLAEAALAGLDDEERGSAYIRTALASLRLAQHNPQAAVDALAPVLDGTVNRTEVQTSWAVEALLLESTARDALGDPEAAGRALTAAEPGRVFVRSCSSPCRDCSNVISGKYQRAPH